MPRENQSNGTDHGTVAPHFVMGGRVRGGLYGVPPVLARLDGNGNLPVGVDFRQLYATVLGPWWGLDASRFCSSGSSRCRCYAFDADEACRRALAADADARYDRLRGACKRRSRRLDYFARHAIQSLRIGVNAMR